MGVEVGGAVKNVLAIAAGISDALELGLNARAALITRGLAEITRFGVALGARAETFMGLTGIGDLILTATGDLSRNRQVGLALGRGATMRSCGCGSWSRGRRRAFGARSFGPRSPVRCRHADYRSRCAVLDGALTPSEALHALLAREPRSKCNVLMALDNPRCLRLLRFAAGPSRPSMWRQRAKPHACSRKAELSSCTAAGTSD